MHGIEQGMNHFLVVVGTARGCQFFDGLLSVIHTRSKCDVSRETTRTIAPPSSMSPAETRDLQSAPDLCGRIGTDTLSYQQEGAMACCRERSSAGRMRGGCSQGASVDPGVTRARTSQRHRRGLLLYCT